MTKKTKRSATKARSEDARARYDAVDRHFRAGLNERGKFDRTSGLPALAASGDREALKACASVGHVLVESMHVPDHLDELKQWLVDVLHRIAGGEKPNKAFGWSQLARGRRRRFEQISRRWMVVQSIAGQIVSNPSIRLKTALGNAAKLYEIPDATAAQYWKDAGELSREK